MRTIIAFFCQFLWVPVLSAQFYLSGMYSHGFINTPTTNTSIQTFNTDEDHTLGDIKFLNGYQIAFGKYGQFSMLEMSFGNWSNSQKSFNPNQLKENAQVVLNSGAVSVNMGLRPFRKAYLIAGFGMNLINNRWRYSFGGDFQTPVNEYAIGGMFFVEYALKLKFLIKKKQRDQLFYLLRIRPYYQIQTTTRIRNFEGQLNNVDVSQGTYNENLSHFGFQVGISIPFLKSNNTTQKHGGQIGGQL